MERTIGLAGIGRMGTVLAQRLASCNRLVLYDCDKEKAAVTARAFGAAVAASLQETAACGTIILAVPDRVVAECIRELNRMAQEICVINIATNVTQSMMEEVAASHIKCISVKLIGHAGEMALGFDPVIIVNEEPPELAERALTIFASVGQVMTGPDDAVAAINNIAAVKALEAAVAIEDELCRRGYASDAIIKSALRQVAAGIIKAYASDDLGPFAAEIVAKLKQEAGKRKSWR